jgi:hypothetical protein
MEKISTLKKIPGVLLQKSLFTVLLGLGFLLVGGAYYIYAKDRIFLVLSILMFVFSLMRSAGLYRTSVGEKYEIIEGTCVGIAVKSFRKQTRVRLLDQNGIETTLCIEKQAKVKIGFRYRFYFKQNGQLTFGSEYLDTVLSTDHFLGFEVLGEFVAQDGDTISEQSVKQ